MLKFSHVYPSTFSSNSECSFFVLGIVLFVAFWSCFMHAVSYVVFHKIRCFKGFFSLFFLFLVLSFMFRDFAKCLIIDSLLSV